MMKNKVLLNLTFAALIGAFLFACQRKYEGKNSLENVKYNSNKATYTHKELDSLQALNRIVRLKLQEVYDLATNYAAGNRDTEIDHTLYQQIQEYFQSPDSLTVSRIISSLDSLQIRYVKVKDVKAVKEISGQDTLDVASYMMEYYDKGKWYKGSLTRQVQYILKELPTAEQKVKGEFKFYFVDFDYQPVKDTIPSGEIK